MLTKIYYFINNIFVLFNQLSKEIEDFICKDS
jgi:hypothetical protein